MFSSQKNLFLKKDIVEYTMPRLHTGKSWYVDFYAYDPTIDGLRRKKYMLDRYRSVKDRKDMASILIYNISAKLRTGWNPFVQTTKSRQHTLFEVVVQRYQTYIDIASRKNILRKKTAVDYASRLNQLLQYVSETNVQIKYIYQFDRIFAVDFLDYLIYDKDVSPKTRNNYRTWLSTFGTWLKDRQYIDANPIEDIHMMREDLKYREALSSQALSRLKEHAQKHCPHFYLACMFEYYTFIRPEELRHIRIGDIDISGMTVTVCGANAKNGKTQAVSINKPLVSMMLLLKVFENLSQDYLFGKNMVPGKEQIYVNQFRIEWKRVREALNFPDCYQFYSLKDSGIRDLANSRGIVVARDQARHSDISVTNKYLKVQNVAHAEVRDFVGEL